MGFIPTFKPISLAYLLMENTHLVWIWSTWGLDNRAKSLEKSVGFLYKNILGHVFRLRDVYQIVVSEAYFYTDINKTVGAAFL